MSDRNRDANSLDAENAVGIELDDDVVDPLEATDDFPMVDDEALEEELEGSFPASDPPSSTPTTSLGGPEHHEDKS